MIKCECNYTHHNKSIYTFRYMDKHNSAHVSITI